MGCEPIECTRRARMEALEARRLLSVDAFDAALLAIDRSSGRVARATQRTPSGAFEVAMYTRDGALDRSFDGDGILRLGDGFEPKRLSFQPDGKLIIAGAQRAESSLVRVRRLNADGSRDLAFGSADGQISTTGSRQITGLASAPGARVMPPENHVGDGGEGEWWLMRSPAHPSGREGPAPWKAAPQTAGSGQQSPSAQTPGPADTLTNHAAPASGFDRLSSHDRDDMNAAPARPVAARADLSPDEQQQGPSKDAPLLPPAPRETPTAVYLAQYLAAGASDRSNQPSTAPDATAPQVAALLQEEKPVIRRESGDGAVEDRMRLLAGDVPEPVVTLNHRGSLIVRTNDRGEQVSVYFRGRDGRMIVRVDNFSKAFVPRRVRRISIFTNGGDDEITIGDKVRSSYVDGGDGNDTIRGGQFSDVLVGGAGRDTIYGNDGDDILVGGHGNDFLVGGAGKDDLYGNGGVDTLHGCGGNDRLDGGAGEDIVSGGLGADAARTSAEDRVKDVERPLK